MRRSPKASIASLATPNTSTSARPQLGQAIRSTLRRSRSPSASKSWRPERASSTGSVVSEYRIVSPMPSESRAAIPAVDLMVPAGGGPASVTPRCSGWSVVSASCR